MTIDGWSHEWELKQITFGGGNTSTWRTGSISRVYAASTRSIYGFSTLDTEFTSLDVCGACSRVLRVLLVALGVLYYSSYSPVFAVFGPSVLVLLILPARAVFRTPHTRVLQYTPHQQYPEYRTPQCCQHSQLKKKKYRTPCIRTCTMQQHHAPTQPPTAVLTVLSGVQQYTVYQQAKYCEYS